MLTSAYNFWLVLASFLVAMLASYAALDIAGRIPYRRRRRSSKRLAGAAMTLGSGIWLVHLTGMLACRVPIRLSDQPGVQGLAWLAAVVFSAGALKLATGTRLGTVSGGVVMGLGITATHFLGAAALGMRAGVPMMPIATVMATMPSGLALWLAFAMRRESAWRTRLFRAIAAVVMGCGMTAMHYTAMAGVQVAPALSMRGAAHWGADLLWLTALVLLATLGGLALVLLASLIEMRLESRTAALASSLENANQELTYLALHDNLTKLPNRLLLEDRLNQAIHGTRRTECPFSVMFLDLDGFKEVNDAFGHSTGDGLLAEVAERIRSAIRASDTLARIGGDEFVLLADLGDPTSAANLADKLVRLVAQPYQIAEQELRISVSIGIVVCENAAQDAQEMLRNASAAMSHAKALGRSGYCFFEPSMNAHAHEQLQLLQELRAALERQEMVLHYQPKFDAATSRFAGVEALVRWVHPTRGMLYPDQFIPLAEKSGVIVQLGEWVLNEACRQMGAWQAQGLTGWNVAVNLSPLQFGHTGLIQLVRETLDRYALEPSCLTFEVTESTAMRDPYVSLVILQKLNDMGVKISIDDFGTGYSSLLYLKRLPASELKIDRGFVRDLAPHTEDAAIVSAIVALGRTLNLSIVAEGIESEAQREFLTEIGCNYLQGFLLGRPMPAEELVAELRAAEERAAAAAVAGQSIRWPVREVGGLRVVPHHS